jgi:hypothetical protein
MNGFTEEVLGKITGSLHREKQHHLSSKGSRGTVLVYQFLVKVKHENRPHASLTTLYTNNSLSPETIEILSGWFDSSNWNEPKDV